MIKVIDIDALFDEYISDYVYSNIGKVKPEEIEDKIPQLYVEFGDVKLDALDGKTPNTYYRDYTCTELLDCLKEHLQSGVAISDFLCEAITCDKSNEVYLERALDEQENEEFLVYVMNMLLELNSKLGASRYIEFIAWDYGESIRELATELLSSFADEIKDKVLVAYEEAESDKKPYFTEILSHCKWDDRVFNVLVNEFNSHLDNVPLYANYLAKYGDDRAIPYLTNVIEDQNISYVDFEELRFAIEALGGTYDKKRDFSKDKTFKKIMEQKPNKPIMS